MNISSEFDVNKTMEDKTRFNSLYYIIFYEYEREVQINIKKNICYFKLVDIIIIILVNFIAVK